LVGAVYQPLLERFVGPRHKALMYAHLNKLVDEGVQVRQRHHRLIQELWQHLRVECLLKLVALVRRQNDLVVFSVDWLAAILNIHDRFLIYAFKDYLIDLILLLGRPRSKFLGLYNETFFAGGQYLVYFLSRESGLDDFLRIFVVLFRVIAKNGLMGLLLVESISLRSDALDFFESKTVSLGLICL
jgi:hypothetical protein